MLQPRPANLRPDWRLVALALLVGIVVLCLGAWRNQGIQAFFYDTDDAMRMSVARDFLGGQNWYDLEAHRLNTPFGAEVHWSRLVDLPIAALLAVFTPLVGPQQALVVTGYVWPLTLLAVLLWISASLALRLVGPQGVLPALLLPILSPAVTNEFQPGRVDHHNVVIILTLATIWMGIEAIRRPRAAVWGGLLAATALAVATEALPIVGAAILVAGLAWVLDPNRADTMRRFGFAFVGGALLHMALYRPPARWLEPACDVLSPFYLVIAIGVAAAFTLASLATALRAPWQRLGLLAILGSVALGVAVLLYPACLQGPYAGMDPWLQRNWLATISEVKPWWASVVDLPAYSLAVGVPVLAATLVVLLRIWRVPGQRLEWAALLVFLLAAATVMLLQIRGSRLAIMPAIPAACWLISAARERLRLRRSLLAGAGLVASWLLFSGIVISLTVANVVVTMPGRALQVAVARSSKQPCIMPPAFTALAAMPPSRIMAPIDLGAHLLLYTPHSVVAAPYHRNQQGVRDTFRFFNDPIKAAQRIVTERSIDLVVICPAMGEVKGMASRAPDSFATHYAAGTLPSWLREISPPDSTLKLYAVERQ